MTDMDFEGWELTVVTRDDKSQVECRKTISDQCKHNGRSSTMMGQVLLIVSNDGWKWNNETGTSDVRLSMNGACSMTLARLQTFVDVTDHARKILKNLSLKIMTLEEITAALSKYYIGPDHGWPVLLGKAGTFEAPDGVEQFVIYPKVLGAINQMNELFENVGNVEVKQEEIGPAVAATLE